MRIQLITNNVGRVFDARDDGLHWWLGNLDDTITHSAADFVAIHLQELAGAAYKKGTARIDDLQKLVDAVRTRFRDYWCSGMFASSVQDSDFTGLGCIVLVRRSMLPQVALFEFGESIQSGDRWRPVSTLDEPLLVQPALPVRWSRHSTFPRNLFDDLVPSWTRKGWLHTRWRVDGQPLDLLNVHLFHDDSNLVALRRSTALSPYANCRHAALKHALTLLAADSPPPAAIGPVPIALCVFGDFNFRLDARRVVELLAAGGEQALERALADPAAGTDSAPSSSEAVEAASTDDAIVQIAIRPSALPPSSPPSPPPSASSTSASGSDWISASLSALTSKLCLCLAAPHTTLTIAAKKFDMDDRARFGREADAFRSCDVEVAACAELHPPLHEIEPPTFPPTYPHRVGAASTSAHPAYDSKRCPSWTDRVLLDASGMRLLRAATDVAYSAVHQELVRNDHNMVHLAFSLSPSFRVGGEPLGVRVLASQAAASHVDGASVSKPAAWRVKAVTEVLVES